MSKTDKTKRLKFRMQEPVFSWKTCSNRETLVVRPNVIKCYKRLEHKRNRKRLVPHTSFRGYGYGEGNYKYALSD